MTAQKPNRAVTTAHLKRLIEGMAGTHMFALKEAQDAGDYRSALLDMECDVQFLLEKIDEALHNWK